VVVQFLTERLYKGTDPAMINQLRQNQLQSGDASTLHGQDPVVMAMRQRVISFWQSLTPQAQLKQASMIPNGIVNGSVQPQSGPISVTPGNLGMASDLNSFLTDAGKLAAVTQLNQMGMRGGAMVQVRRISDFD